MTRNWRPKMGNNRHHRSLADSNRGNWHCKPWGHQGTATTNTFNLLCTNKNSKLLMKDCSKSRKHTFQLSFFLNAEKRAAHCTDTYSWMFLEKMTNDRSNLFKGIQFGLLLIHHWYIINVDKLNIKNTSYYTVQQHHKPKQTAPPKWP